MHLQTTNKGTVYIYVIIKEYYAMLLLMCRILSSSCNLEKNFNHKKNKYDMIELIKA